MMAQYLEIKAANPDCLLFYRMGDFYEMFFGDAEVASRALGIALTKRGKHLGADIPMCGVPIHAADQYLQKLIALGHRVAVCEQVEDPAEARKRGSKSVVRRNVIRLVTPGTLTEDALLSATRNNYLAAVARQRGGAAEADAFALAWIDISTGEFRVAASDRARLAADLARIEPSEVLARRCASSPTLSSPPSGAAAAAVTPLSAAFFDGATAADRLAAYFGVASLDGFGAFSRVEFAAAAAALAYVEKTQLGARPPLVATGRARPPATPCSSTPPPAPISSSPRRSPASAAAASSRPSTARSPAAAPGCSPGGSPVPPPTLRSFPAGSMPSAWLLADAGRRAAAPRRACRRTRSLPLAVAPHARPRRPARSCRHRRCACRCRQRPCRNGQGAGGGGKQSRCRRSLPPSPRPGAPSGGARRHLPRRSPTNCRT